MGNLSDLRRLARTIDADHHKDKGFCFSEIDGEGFFARMKHPENLLFDKPFNSPRILKVTPFEALPDALDQLSGCLNPQVGFEEERLQFIEKVLIDSLFPKKEAVDLFDKSLMGFEKALFSFFKKTHMFI